MLDSIKSLNKEDFDPLSLVAPIDEHTKDISNLTTRLKALEDKFGSHTQIANTLLETSNEAVKMSVMLENSFLNLIRKNEPIRNAIKELIKSEDRNFIATQIKQWKIWIGAAFVFLIAQASSETVKFFYHLYFPNH
jgi:hypothetical protein